MRNSLCLAMILAGVPGAALAGQPCPDAPAPAATLTAEADRVVAAAYSADAPGAAVIVSRGGEVVYAASRGLAEVENARPITPDTVFRVGSIAKQFTAAMILQLIAQGELSLDDPLSRFFPDWPQPGARATVRQLLNHTSGIFDFSKIPGFLGSEQTQRPNTTAELLAVIRSRPAKAEPGAEWEYNNSGYVILGAILEQVTGHAWADEVRARIARPLGLASLSDAVSADARPATAHFYGNDGDKFVPAQGAHLSVAGGAGNLAMSVRDFAKWSHALDTGKVLPAALYTEMTKPAELADGSTRPYGMGFRLQRLLGEPVFVHGGAARGVDTDAIYVPGKDLVIAVFANSDRLPVDASTVSRRLALAALGQPYPLFNALPVDDNAVAPLLGLYKRGNGPDIRFFARDGKLFIGAGDDEHQVFPAGGDRFFLGRDTLAWFSFERPAGGTPVLVMHEPDEAEAQRAVRIGDAPAPFSVAAAVLEGYVGAYTTEVGMVTLAFDARGQLTIAMGDGPAMAMRPVSETEFRVDAGKFAVEFHPEGARTDRMSMTRGARTLNGVRKVD